MPLTACPRASMVVQDVALYENPIQDVAVPRSVELVAVTKVDVLLYAM